MVKFTFSDISYQDGAAISGESSQVFFTPSSFKISISEIPANRDFFYTDEAFAVTIQALSHKNEITENYRGEVILQLPDGVVIGEEGISSSYEFTENDSGTKRFSNVSGTQEGEGVIVVTDSNYADISSESAQLEFKKGWIVVEDNEGEVGDLNVYPGYYQEILTQYCF